MFKLSRERWGVGYLIIAIILFSRILYFFNINERDLILNESLLSK